MGLIARALEQEGVSTICVVLNRDIAENVMPPRALHVHFPYGAPLGPAHHAETQEAVIKAALGVLVNAAEPGTIVEAGIEWPD